MNKSKISVLVDNDKSLGLETNSPLRSFFNFFFIPILNNLPRSFKNLIKKTNDAASVVINNATNHKALEVLYNKGKSSKNKSIRSRFFQYVWFNLNNSKAVRNRLKLVKRELRSYLKNISQTDRDIEIINIASGSSRAIIEIVQDGHYLQGTKLSISFLDKDERAIAYSKNLSTCIQHLPIKLEWIHDSVGNFLRNDPTKKYDVVEIVGLFDYFNDQKIIETMRGIHNILQPGGIMIAANINHNTEERFITKVIDWPMIYRSAEKLASLAQESGFRYNSMKVFYEPLMIHGIVVAQK